MCTDSGPVPAEYCIVGIPQNTAIKFMLVHSLGQRLYCHSFDQLYFSLFLKGHQNLSRVSTVLNFCHRLNGIDTVDGVTFRHITRAVTVDTGRRYRPL